jgi:2-haloacid dehalogenase
MQSYDSLSTFPDVASCLSAINNAPDVTAYVFSNGTYDMVASSIRNSPDLMHFAPVFKEVVVVEEVKRFKPDPAVYRYLCKKAGKEGREGDVWLVTGNPFDVVGARAMGWKAVWVDRAGNGWVDSCVEGEAGRPSVIVRSLKQVLTAVSEYRGT